MRSSRTALPSLVTAGLAIALMVPACGGSGDDAASNTVTPGQSAGGTGASGAAAGGRGGSSAGGGAGASGMSTGGASVGGASAGGASAGGASAGGKAGTGGASGGGGKSGGSQAGGSAGASGAAGNAGAGGCTSASECNGGVCVSGICCATAAGVCGTQCCDGGTVCLFDSCVLPGKTCHTSHDCQSSEYCEPALGDNGGSGGSGAGGSSPSCAQAPLQGKCVAIPPICDASGQPPGCLPGTCEYMPPAKGKLDAVEKWIWGPDGHAQEHPNLIDVWSTPLVGRVTDTNCDGKIDELDPPNLIFVSNDVQGGACQSSGTTPLSSCHTGILRVLDGGSGKEVWSLRNLPGSAGFAGMTHAIGDLDGDGRLDIAAVTAEGLIVVLDGTGKLLGKASVVLAGYTTDTFGWGGGLSIADLDLDGSPEIIWASQVFTTKGMKASGMIPQLWKGVGGGGGTGVSTYLSYAVDLDGAADGHLEVVAGKTAYRSDGSVLWTAKVADGFTAVGDFDKNGTPEVVHVADGVVTILDGATGVVVVPGFALPDGPQGGGAPTVADFDGDKIPDVGVAQANFYSAVHVDMTAKTSSLLWKTPNHDKSSNVTGSSVFDFEGDGRAEVIYNDECFLYVFDGKTGNVRFATPTDSFTATESSVVADVDGDGHAEIIRVANGADPTKWTCAVDWTTPDPVTGRPGWTPPTYGPAHRGVAVFGDAANSWVGTRTLWSEHAYHVTNICDDRDNACVAPDVYGAIPSKEKDNWKLGWLNNFRQNVQDKGIFDAADAVVSLVASCTDPVVVTVSVKNIGLAPLPKGVDVDVLEEDGGEKKLGTVTTTHPLSPGQTEQLPFSTMVSSPQAVFRARIVVDPMNPKFHECREDNDQSADVQPMCVKP